MKRLKTCLSALSALATMLVMAQPATAQYTPVFYDGFAVSADTQNINLEVGVPRQGGPLAPVSYVTNTPNAANDYHHQLFSIGTSPSQPLQLAGDLNVTGPVGLALMLASPNYNFKGAVGGGILGKRISVDMDVAVVSSPVQGQSYVQGSINVGSDTPLVESGTAATHFAVRFIEDQFSGNGNFIQLFDGSTVVGNLIANPAGAGQMNVQLDVNDLVDGNPWDGVGSTTIDVYVNASLVGSYTKGAGGYANNYMTLEGGRNFFGNGLATHLVDNLTVFSAPVPEPSTAALAAVALCGSPWLRRRLAAAA